MAQEPTQMRPPGVSARCTKCPFHNYCETHEHQCTYLKPFKHPADQRTKFPRGLSFPILPPPNPPADNPP